MGAPPDRPSSSSSCDSVSSASTTSLVFERIAEREASEKHPPPQLATAEHELLSDDPLKEADSPSDLETGAFLPGSHASRHAPRPMDKRLRRALCIVVALLIASWAGGLLYFLTAARSSTELESHGSSPPTSTAGTHAEAAEASQISLEELQSGAWSAKLSSISWINGPNGEDGLLLNQSQGGKDFLVVEDVTAVDGNEEDAIDKDRTRRRPRAEVQSAVKTLMRQAKFDYGGKEYSAAKTWPSPDHAKVLVATDVKNVWRHSFTAVYWVLDVGTQTVEPLDPLDASARVQLASWSPQSDSIMYTRDNNLFLRHVAAKTANQPSANKKPHGPTQITRDGGQTYFYGIPDWVYEEEVFGGNSATWWSADGKYVAFLRTNESGVPEFPIDYYIQRRPGVAPPPEGYPDVLKIKYPKAGAPNPVVHVQFYDVEKGEVFSVDISDDFADHDRLITNLFWAGDKVVVKETNRVSDVMRVVLVDVAARAGKTTRTVDVSAIDNGWFEISQKTTYVPADPGNGRPADGYIDTVIHDNGDHLAYFTPLDASEPRMLTSGPWEVVDAPSAVDLKSNLVYFLSTKESSVERHVYSVSLHGHDDIRPVTNTSADGFYSVSFSAGAGYVLLTHRGPQIPWQTVQSTPANPNTYERVVESNQALADKAGRYALPQLEYGSLTLDDDDKTTLNYVERRPHDFDPSRKYPVLFYQYSGPGSQTVTKAYGVNWQSYVASSLGYVVVTVDGRGTGFIGRKSRVVVRGHLGRYESRDQIFAGKHWASLPYVDPDRLAIWGWSFGGFNALKTLEVDGGRTFRYGMAVAPVTDWRFYDSIYTERYMLLPRTNEAGYSETAISNVSALASNVRFLIMHGTGDDNVHFQNTLALLDKLDLENVVNYDVHVFPDSNHGIYFHDANRVVYEKLTQWLINAFNGEWARLRDAEPKELANRGVACMQSLYS